MTLLLRTVRQNRWHKAAGAQWLDNGDVPADPLADLSTSSNKLSVWVVEPDKANLERVVRAVAIGREKLDHSGWVLFDSAPLLDLGIKIVDNPGSSDDDGANHWHRNLEELSGLRIVGLVRSILVSGESGLMPKKRMVALVEAGLQAGELPERVRQRFKA